jgi:tRNA G18 (ribose-2'-O)-methylase SpoU
MIVEVADPLDPRIEPYRQVRERDLVGRQGLYIAEGRVVIEKALAAGRHPLVSMLVAQQRLAALAPLLDLLASDVPVYAAAQPVMDAIAGFPVHRGLLALGRRAEPSPAALLAGLPAEALVVALVGIANHDNMGGVFRNVAAFGADAVLLDATCCDPLYRKAIRVSVGAALTIPFARLDAGADLLAELEAAGFEVVALSPRGAVELGDLPSLVGRTAALIGAEGPGLSPDLLARAKTVRIDMTQGFDSLNVATTSGIFLHHLRAGRAGR